jgi:hypothetical protein
MATTSDHSSRTWTQARAAGSAEVKLLTYPKQWQKSVALGSLLNGVEQPMPLPRYYSSANTGCTGTG